MDLRKIIFVFLLLIPFLVRGQEYRVESFENVPADLTARTESRVDNNGRKCGLIKVYVKDAITATGGPVIGEVVDRGMEKWVYVAHDAKKIQLLFKEHMPLYVTFDDFNYPTITGQMTYILKLKEDDETQASISNQGHPSGDTNGLVVSQQQNQNQENIMLTPQEMSEKGEAAYDRKNYEEAVKWYRKAAEQGFAKAQTNLGIMYRYGYGVAKDYSEAVKWYRKAAEQGYATAQNNLGIMYDNGYGVAKDYSEAVKWYRKAAEQGFAKAQTNLGSMYFLGYGVAKDYSEAVNWYRKAAEQGNADAQYNLGFMYKNGYGVAENLSEARTWYEKAAAQGDEDAKERLKNL